MTNHNRLSDTDTPRGIGELAKHDYQQHLNAVKKNELYIHAPLGAEALASVEVMTEKGTPSPRNGESWEDHRKRIQQGRVKGNLERAAINYNQHQAEYFDAALIDAHLDGVQINVEQPLEIGQKIEVHTPDHR